MHHLESDGKSTAGALLQGTYPQNIREIEPRFVIWTPQIRRSPVWRSSITCLALVDYLSGIRRSSDQPIDQTAESGTRKKEGLKDSGRVFRLRRQ
jgi:hypothetical protein